MLVLSVSIARSGPKALPRCKSGSILKLPSFGLNIKSIYPMQLIKILYISDVFSAPSLALFWYIIYIAYIFMRCFDLFLSHMIMVLFRGPMLSYESKTWILWLPFVTCERFYWKIVTLILIIQFTSAVASSNSKFEKKKQEQGVPCFFTSRFYLWKQQFKISIV